MSDPLFLIGAGFNMDANSHAHNEGYAYPLVSDLAKTCFGLADVPEGKSIEGLFQSSLEQRERQPFEQLCDLVTEADYRIGELFTGDNTQRENPYFLFLEEFQSSHFLTFNYDALLEMLLFHMKRRKPDDGYGIDVVTEQHTLVLSYQLPDRSKNLVLHLHGTFCVYPVEFYLERDGTSSIEWIKNLDKPRYVFDPDSLTHRFFPYRRILTGPSYSFPYERVIAPVPDKAQDLKRDFIHSVYRRAVTLIEKYDPVIAIGYRFSEYDSSSYRPLLQSISNLSKRLFVISPSAEEIADRIEVNFDLRTVPITLTFAGWASNGFVLS